MRGCLDIEDHADEWGLAGTYAVSLGLDCG
jgi:hypothetical protein